MLIQEVAFKGSLVLNILRTAFVKDIPLNFDLHISTTLQNLFRPVRYGRIDNMYFSERNNRLEIVIIIEREQDIFARSWTYRFISPSMFDDEFTLKKIDGVLTLTKKLQHAE